MFLLLSLWCNGLRAGTLSSSLGDLWQRTEWAVLPDYITYFQRAEQLGAVMGFV